MVSRAADLEFVLRQLPYCAARISRTAYGSCEFACRLHLFRFYRPTLHSAGTLPAKMNPQCSSSRSGMRTVRMRAIGQRCPFPRHLLRRPQRHIVQAAREHHRNCKQRFQPEGSTSRQHHLSALVKRIEDYLHPEDRFVLRGMILAEVFVEGRAMPTGRKRWSQEVTERSNALDLEQGVFSKQDPRSIARSLKRSADRSRRRKSDPFRSAMSMLSFYINRAGKNLSQSRRAKLESAKKELRRLYGRLETART